MSRRSVEYRRKVSQTDGSVEATDKLIPRRAIVGWKGTYLRRVEVKVTHADYRTPGAFRAEAKFHDRDFHPVRGGGRVTAPMDEMKAMMLRASLVRK